MKISLHIGERGTVEQFRYAYNAPFLMDYGFAILDKFRSSDTLFLVYTKNGAEKVRSTDVVTYVGNKKWSIERFNHEAKENENY